jgi:hypothetical protein
MYSEFFLAAIFKSELNLTDYEFFHILYNADSTPKAVRYFNSIGETLRKMFSNEGDRKAWMTTLHPDLNEIPLTLIMCNMEGLEKVHSYIVNAQERGA